MPPLSGTASAMRPTARTASRAMEGEMSRAYSVSSVTMSYTLDWLHGAARGVREEGIGEGWARRYDCAMRARGAAAGHAWGP